MNSESSETNLLFPILYLKIFSLLLCSLVRPDAQHTIAASYCENIRLSQNQVIFFVFRSACLFWPTDYSALQIAVGNSGL